MKYLTLLFFAVIILSKYTSAQTQPASTTEEEYNYVSIGYKNQIAGGYDMKKGYHFNQISNMQIGNYVFTLKSLIREEKSEIAALLVITKSNISNRIYYLCIPHGSDELAKRYIDELYKWDQPISQAYAYFISTLYGNHLPILAQLSKAQTGK